VVNPKQQVFTKIHGNVVRNDFRLHSRTHVGIETPHVQEANLCLSLLLCDNTTMQKEYTYCSKQLQWLIDFETKQYEQ
jgi:hypothetical protein